MNLVITKEELIRRVRMHPKLEGYRPYPAFHETVEQAVKRTLVPTVQLQ